MKFQPFVTRVYDNAHILTTILPAADTELQKTTLSPAWRTDWTSDYIQQSNALIYAQKTESGELVGLAAYEILKEIVAVSIVYMESEPGSGPEIVRENRNYRNIGRAFIAFGIKLSIDHGFNGDITFFAKTPELAEHYERDFEAIRVPSRGVIDSAPRYLICDDAAQSIFEIYLEEDET